MRRLAATNVAFAGALCALAACGGGSAQGAPTQAPPEGTPQQAPPEGTPQQAPPEGTPQQAPPPPPPAHGCHADARHCCLPDGTLVTPGGCSPSYPEGVIPATERADDGSCRRIPCYLRCLPAAARIATPSGDVEVSRLREGDVVYTRDASGARVAVPVLRVASRPVVGAHSVVEVTLTDGRVVRASAGHPLADGTAFSGLRAGARLDGSTVVATRTLRYDGDATWDLLPAGATGLYWADGVLLGSTLAP